MKFGWRLRRAAYEQPTYEETLTLHRLGCVRALSLKTTNLLESIHARVASRTDKVDVWKSSDQKQRWVATAPPNFNEEWH